MAVNGFEFTDLSQEQISKIKSLEQDINNEMGSEIILLAFNRED